VVYLNDSLNQGDVLCQKWYAGAPFIRDLELLEEKTRPLPAVYLSPKGSSTKKTFMEEFGVGFPISLSFKKLISEYNTFFKGGIWDLDKSTKYIKKYKEIFIKCDSLDEIDKEVEDLVVQEKIPKASGSKMMAVFHEIFEKNILDISNNIDENWSVVIKDSNGEVDSVVKYPPLIASLYADLVPVLMTASFIDEEYFAQLFTYYGKQIFNYQANDGYFSKNKISIWVMIDEVPMIASRSNKSLPSQIFDLLVAQGRPIRIGTFYAIQNYSELSKKVRGNTNYVFSVRQNDAEAKEIANDFTLDTTEKKDLIRGLKSLQPREIMACSKTHFITYDNEGNRLVEKGPFKGGALPPLHASATPKKVEVEQVLNA